MILLFIAIIFLLTIIIKVNLFIVNIFLIIIVIKLNNQFILLEFFFINFIQNYFHKMMLNILGYLNQIIIFLIIYWFFLVILMNFLILKF